MTKTKKKTKPNNGNSRCQWKLSVTNKEQCQEIYVLITILMFLQS